MGEQDFYIYKGDHKIITFTIEGVDDLSTANSIIFVASKTVETNPLIVKRKEDMTIEGNNVSVELQPDDTAQDGFRKYNYYELEVTDSAGNISTVAQGKMELKDTMDNLKII